MIVSAAIVPHSPLLIPHIGRERQKKLKKTLHAFDLLSAEFKKAQPETLLIFTPHARVIAHSFPLFVSAAYHSNFKEFGDFSTTFDVPADLKIISSLRQMRIAKNRVPLVSVTEEQIDYGAAVPLYFFSRALPKARAVIIGHSDFSVVTHKTAGRRLGELLHGLNRRIAVVASADLAHTLNDDAPGGFSPQGKMFDEAIVQSLRGRSRVFHLPSKDGADAAKSCGLRVIAILLGALEGLNASSEIISYEAPFGVGHVVAKFNFH